MSDLVVVHDDGAVRVIRLNRLEKKNALTQPMYAVITQALRDAQAERVHPLRADRRRPRCVFCRRGYR